MLSSILSCNSNYMSALCTLFCSSLQAVDLGTLARNRIDLAALKSTCPGFKLASTLQVQHKFGGGGEELRTSKGKELQMFRMPMQRRLQNARNLTSQGHAVGNGAAEESGSHLTCRQNN